ncbi:MAG: NUDIX domain-containing protein [Clostridiales bacterium]|jgi:ADP-ribose pyrophosphatase YjhB (NUDIX family)|nr:NUDIX domain-containing protein [Clostridiales bacterium]
MNLNNKDFILTVNLAMFKMADEKRTDIKKLPQKELMVLLTKRRRAPYKDCWSFPYGFVNIDESLDDAVYRELAEKTNLKSIYFEQLYTWGALDRDPSARVIATSYIAMVQNENISTEAAEDSDYMKWFSVKKKLISAERRSDEQLISEYIITLQNGTEEAEMAYTVTEDIAAAGFEKRTKYSYQLHQSAKERMAYDHIKILDCALDRIKNKVLYTNIAFGLIPEQFTLTELQQVYEVLLGKSLIKPNFRKWVNKKVEPTEDTKKDGAHRPSKLYRLRRASIIEDPDVFG